MTTASTKKAICYYRVSSQHQQERQSISMQKTRLHKFARDKGYKIVAEYQDDGISGEDIDKRPGFQEVLETIQNDSADVLLVYMVDRIGRFKKRKDRHYITQLLEDNQVSVDSPYHSLYDCKSEEDLNKLEADLVESRRDNKMRGIRISEGHMEVRRRGGYSGGQMPYGYKYDKKKKKFSVDEPRNETLKTIIELLTQGWGLQKVARLLNSDPKKYPLARKKKYKSVGWWPATIRNIVMNDLYFTGILTPKKKKSSSGEDMVAVDTGIKLFSKEEIMEARRKMAERCTYDSAKGRKDLKSQFLLAGFLKCGECGRTIGPNLSKQKNGPPLRYYRCRGYNHDLCSRKKGYRADELEDVVMYNFINKLPRDSGALEKAILEEEFIQDADRGKLEALVVKAEKDLDALEEERKKVLLQNRKGYLTDKELDKQMNEILEARVAAEEELRKARQQLERPEQVKAAVKAATQMVSDDINVELTYWEYLDRGTEFYELPYEERLRIEREEPDHPMMKLERRIKEVRARLKDREEEVEKLTKKEIKDWIFLQKRLILRVFLGPGGFIRVTPDKDRDYTVEVKGIISLQNIPASVFSYKSS